MHRVQYVIRQQKVALFGYESMDVLEAVECVCGNLVKGLKKLSASGQSLND